MPPGRLARRLPGRFFDSPAGSGRRPLSLGEHSVERSGFAIAMGDGWGYD